MALAPHCKTAVMNVLGRTTLSQRAEDDIQRFLGAAFRTLSESDPNFASMNPAARAGLAAKKAAEMYKKQADARATKVLVDAQKLDDLRAFSAQTGDQEKALNAIAFARWGMREGIKSVEAVKNALTTKWTAPLEAAFAKSQRLFGLMGNRQFDDAVIDAMYGRASTDPDVTAAAAALRAANEGVIRDLESAGGIINERPDYMPLDYNVSRILKQHGYKEADAKRAWVSKMLDWTDGAMYNSNGTVMSRAQRQRFLEESFDTIASNGLNKKADGKYTTQRIGDMTGKIKRIYFKDAEAHKAYLKEYDDRSLLQIQMAYVNKMSREVAFTDVVGSRANWDQLKNDGIGQLIARNDANKANKFDTYADELGDHLTGRVPPVKSPRMAQAFSNVRSLLTAARMGKAALMTPADLVNSMAVQMALKNGIIPYVGNLARAAVDSDLRARMRTNGIALDGAIGAINRYAEDTGVTGLPNKLAQALVKVSGLQLLTEINKAGFASTVMESMGRKLKQYQTWDEMADNADTPFLQRKAFDATDWKIFQAAGTRKYRNMDLFEVDAIYSLTDPQLQAIGVTRQQANAAAQKYHALLDDLSSFAVITPGDRTRFQTAQVLQTNRLKKGTVPGELLASMTQFKSTPIAMMMNHWENLKDLPPVGKALYAARFIALTYVGGIMADMAYAVADGRDPQALSDYFTDPKAMTRAFTRAGAVGFLGDMLLADATGYGQNFLSQAMGPTAGMINDAYNVVADARGLDAQKTGSGLIRLAKNMTPFQNLWYTKAAMDQLIVHDLQEWLSPGYRKRLAKRTRDMYNGSDMWSDPYGGMRMPDIGKIFE